MTKNILRPSDFLSPEQRLSSNNQQFNAILQNDGNFVIYHSSQRALWSTGTCSLSSKTLILQDDGNLVLYDRNNKPIWASNTFGNSNTLILQDDGNLVLYSKNNEPIWDSGTYYPVSSDSKEMESILLKKVVDNLSKKHISLEFNQQFIHMIKNSNFCFGHIVMNDNKNVECHLYGNISNQAKDFRNIIVSIIQQFKNQITVKLNFFMQFEDGLDYSDDILEFIKKHIILLSPYSKIGREDIEILIPDMYMMLQKNRKDFYATMNNNIPYQQRIPIAKFRGSQTGGVYNLEEVRKMNLPRLKANHLSKQYPQLLDSKLISYDCQNTGGQEYINYMNKTFGPPAPKQPMSSFNQYRYLLCFDGNQAPPFARPETIMISRSVPFFQTEYIKYWTCFLKDHENCIFIKKDLSNLISSIQEMNQNYKKSLEIATKARELAEKILLPSFQDLYFISVMNHIGQN